MFAERDGLVAIEAEHFTSQTQTDRRAWYLTTRDLTPDVQPDGDGSHIAGASGGAYLELLPDTRRTHDDKLVPGENFSNEPGKMAILSYPVEFTTPGVYHLWARAFTTTSEDNGLHFGLDGQWPETAQRWQTVVKGRWHWESKQRTNDVHTGVPDILTLTIDHPGRHIVQVCMREDGIALDKILLVNRKDYRPEGLGPDSLVAAGTLPPAFPFVTAPLIAEVAAEAVKANEDIAAIWPGDLDLTDSGYYLEQKKWLAINPKQHQEARVTARFAYPTGRYDVTLEAVGESDGASTYQVLRNAEVIGRHTCPLSEATFETGPKFHAVWKDVTLTNGDRLEIASRIATEDGQKFSCGRWSALVFTPADEATRIALAAMLPQSLVPFAAEGPPLVESRQPDGDGKVTISGELKRWHKVTLDLSGPFAHERDREPNPFTDCNFRVTFTHASGSPRYVVPGYFAADGKAAESGAEQGTVWRAHLSPDKPGEWTYAVSFTRGKHAALDGGGDALRPFDGQTGKFTVGASDKTGRDFRAHGRLQYVGERYLKFAGSGEYFLKAGPDAPETLLGYSDFDGTIANLKRVPLKTYAVHSQDWRAGDPTWRGGKGKGLIGALNYIADQGMNAFSFLTYNAGGDGDNVWPFIAHNAKLHYDCSKLDQWGIVFDHATQLGLYLHFKLQEQENDDNRAGQDARTKAIAAALDGGELGPERKLYCRELIARFGHALALNWNIGEENTQSTAEQVDMIRYLHDTDPYHHHIVIHTFPNWQDRVYEPLLGSQSLLTGASLQNGWNNVHQRTLKWVRASQDAGRPWVVTNDEQGPAGLGVPPDPGYSGHDGVAREKPDQSGYTLHDIRKATLWGNLLAGGAGVEYYFGYGLPQNDLVCEDWRSREQSWKYCRIALDFFREHQIPFQKMACHDELVGNENRDNSRYCFALPGEIYVVLLPNGGELKLDLRDQGGKNFQVHWFNPRAGGALQASAISTVAGGAMASLGTPPADESEDWVVLVRRR